MVHTQGGLWPRVLLFHGGRGSWPLRPVKRDESWGGLRVHTQGGAHTRRCTHKAVHARCFMANVGVLPFKGCAGLGPRLQRSETKQGVVWERTHKVVHTQGGAYTRRCTHKAVGCYFKGGGDWPPFQPSEPKQGVLSRCTHKVVHTQGGAHTRRFVATARVLFFQGGGWPVEQSEPNQGVVWRSTHKVVHTQSGAHTKRCTHKMVRTQGGAHTRRSVATAGVLSFKGGPGAGPRVE